MAWIAVAVTTDALSSGHRHPPSPPLPPLTANPEDTPSIVCLDAGLAYEVQRHTRMVEILGALMMRDGRTAGRHMITPITAADDHIHAEQAVAAYCEGMQDLVDSSAHIRFFEHLGECVIHLSSRHVCQPCMTENAFSLRSVSIYSVS